MSTSPKMDMQGEKIIISCMAMEPIENALNKGQKVGDATKVIASSELGVMDIQMPKIDVNIELYKVKDGYREIGSEKVKIKINSKQRKMQLARIEEQKENSQEIGR